MVVVDERLEIGRDGHARRTLTRSWATLVDLLDADVCILSGARGVRPSDDLPLAGLVGQSVADLEMHRQHASDGRRRGLLLGPELNHLTLHPPAPWPHGLALQTATSGRPAPSRPSQSRSPGGTK
jgi:hypothetical protein